MNAKAIALFAVLAVALTGGFAIVGADAADGDDFTAEYMTVGPLEGVQITFDVAPYDKIDWLGTVYGDEGTIVKNVLLKFDGNKTAIAWKAKPLAVGTYQVEIADKDQTTTYSGSFVVPEKFTVTFTAEGTLVKELTVDDGTIIADEVPEIPAVEGMDPVGWVLPGSVEPFDFENTAITQDLDFTALYEPKEYTITVDSEIQNGTVTADKEKAKAGETVTLTVTPAEGYQVASVTVDGEEIEESSFTMPAKDVTVSATFELIPEPEYTIAVDPEIQNGTVTADKEKAKAGETVTLTVAADEGYTLAGVTVNEEPIEGTTFEMPAENVTVSALFVVIPVIVYDVTISELIENGTVTADPVKAEEGDLITITATPDDGYQTVAIYVDGQPLLEGENTFLMPAKNVEVSAVFAEIPVGGSTVTYVDVNGVIETKSYEIGEEVVYHVTTVPEGMKLGSVDFDPWMACLIDHEACTVEFIAAEGNYTATISYIAPFTVYLVDQDGKSINDFQYFVEDSVEIDMGMYLGVEVESVTSMPEIDDLECEDGVITFTMPAQDVTVTVTLKPIVPETVKVVFMDDETEVAIREVPVETILEDVPEAPEHQGMTFTGWYREGSDVPYDFETMPVMENMTVYAQYEEGPITDKVTVTFYDITGEEVLAVVSVDAGTLVPADEIPEAPLIEGMNFRGWMTEDQELFDFETEAVEDDMDVYAFYLPEPVASVDVTFVDGETETVVSVDIGECVVAPEAAGKEGYNFVGWFKEGFEQSFDFETPITEPLTLFAKYIETPQIEGFAVLYHDMYQGEPVDIWWKGYTSKDDRVMLANGMDATPGVVFKGWLAEDQKTLLTWNAAYDLNDIERNDCLIYPAYYGYPGTDGIYELNAIYELHIQWIGFDGETVIDEQDVIRGAFLEPSYSDDDMTAMLEQYKPSDKEYKYSWTGWRIGDSETTYTSEQIGSVKVDGAWKIYATYGKDLNEYDITFNWHDGTSTIRVPYGEVPEIENPPAYEDDNFTYTFAGWDPEVTEVTGDATYTATYDKTSKLKDIVINVNNADYGYFTYGDEEKKEFMLPAPLDCDAGVIDGNVLTFDFVIYENGEEVPQTHVFTAFPNPDDTMHYEFIEWTVSEDGNTYTANFVTDIITSKDLDRIQTFFDYTKTEGGDVVFTLKSKDGLAIPKGTMTVWYYEIAYLEDIEDWVQIERSCDAIAMDWDEETYGDNLISMTIEYADLTQDGEAFDITSKTISTMWLVFDGVNGAHCESNKATPGQ